MMKMFYTLVFTLVLMITFAQSSIPNPQIATLPASSDSEYCEVNFEYFNEPYSLGEYELSFDLCVNVTTITEFKRNAEAQRIHRVKNLHELGLTGNGITVGVWDDGNALPFHIELSGRVQTPEVTSISDHATHVVGTIAATGITSDTKGIAPNAKVASFDFRGDNLLAEIERNLHLGMSVTNHSYGIPGGWRFGPSDSCHYDWQWIGRNNEIESFHFGYYSQYSRAFDEVGKKYPQITLVASAGNERGLTKDPTSLPPYLSYLFDGNYCKITPLATQRFNQSAGGIPPSDAQDGLGFDTLTGNSLAKNVITVAALNDVNNYDTTQACLYNEIDDKGIPICLGLSDLITSFTSLGPSDDLRVKPDILANGEKLYSTGIIESCRPRKCTLADYNLAANNIYQEMSGTSMASPVVTGTLALLNELAIEKIGRTLFSDEAKAILIHSAGSLRADYGPTRAGWGWLDASKAVQIIEQTIAILIRPSFVKAENPYIFAAKWNDKDSDVRVTLTWLDLPGHVKPEMSYPLDDPTPVLRNNLDMYIRSPSGKIFYPWRQTSNPNQPLRDDVNSVDNVEKIDIPVDFYENGEWQIVISTANIEEDQLDAAIVVSGLDEIKTFTIQ